MKKIGILFWDEFREGSQSHEMNKSFIYAVEQSQAIPIGIPSVMTENEMDNYLAILDGVIFTGGEDISPFLYGEEPILETKELNIKRDRSEYRFMEKVFERKVPAFAVCRGMQLANAVNGGNLYQDIPSQKPDSIIHLPNISNPENFKKQYHSIDIKEGSHLAQVLGTSHIVNSYHHQGIKELAPCFDITAQAKDGIIEAVETKNDHFFIGVQFHPEFTEDSDSFQNLFNYFVEGIN